MVASKLNALRIDSSARSDQLYRLRVLKEVSHQITEPLAIMVIAPLGVM